jgi:hypothetical protein
LIPEDQTENVSSPLAPNPDPVSFYAVAAGLLSILLARTVHVNDKGGFSPLAAATATRR